MPTWSKDCFTQRPSCNFVKHWQSCIGSASDTKAQAVSSSHELRLTIELHLAELTACKHTHKPQRSLPYGAHAAVQGGLVVVEVISVKAHPKADKLRVCSVDYGHDVAQVVTNAANMSAGMRVIFAVRPVTSPAARCAACSCPAFAGLA